MRWPFYNHPCRQMYLDTPRTPRVSSAGLLPLQRIGAADWDERDRRETNVLTPKHRCEQWCFALFGLAVSNSFRADGNA